MPKYAEKKTLREIKSLRKTGLFSIGYVPGLCVRVNPSGGSSYVFRYKVAYRERVVTIGSIDIINLKTAIAEAMNYKVMILRNEDPVLYKKAKKAEMLKQVNDDLNKMRKIDEP